MKKLTILVALALALSVPSVMRTSSSYAADNQPPRPAGQQLESENFPELKARLLERLDDRMKRLTEEKACVEAAQSIDDLRKCRPQRPDRPERPGMQQGGQMPRGQMPGQMPGGPMQGNPDQRPPQMPMR